MSTGVIIAIVVVAIVLIALAVVFSRKRRLESRRETAGELRREAHSVTLRAERQRATADEQEARARQAEAEAQEKAALARRETAEARERAAVAERTHAEARERHEEARDVDPDEDDDRNWTVYRIGALAHAARKRPDLEGELFALAWQFSSGKLRGKPAIPAAPFGRGRASAIMTKRRAVST